MRLLEIISRWMGRVEVVLAGADDELRAGEEALAMGEPMRARALARGVLERLPGSPLGLALLADACEGAGLDAELALTLEELAGRIGSNAEVWLRLAHARQKIELPIDEVRATIVRALALAEAGSDARRRPSSSPISTWRRTTARARSFGSIASPIARRPRSPSGARRPGSRRTTSRRRRPRSTASPTIPPTDAPR